MCDGGNDSALLEEALTMVHGEVVEEQVTGKLNYWHRRSSISKAVLLQVKESLMENGLKTCVGVGVLR